MDWDPAPAEEAVGQVIRIGQVVEPTETLPVIAEDPSDDRVREAAAAGEAGIIVSGDRHLLRLGSWRGERILNPAAFVDELG